MVSVQNVQGGSMKNKIIKMLDKVESEELLERIYEFVKYIYIHVQ